MDHMVKSIIKKRPQLASLLTAQSILEYLRPAIEWRQQSDIFPHASVLSKLITTDIGRLYGHNYAARARRQLKESWVVETGAHLHIPRRYNKATQTNEPQINSLLFQGQVLWALANRYLGNKMSFSLNSGRVPLDNTNSGVYLDLPSLKTPLPLASKNKYPDSPQSLIPASSTAEIKKKLELLAMYKKQKMIPENEYLFGEKILSNFLAVQSSFSDQVATTHALLLNNFLPTTQVTLDSESIGKDFIVALLKDQTSFTYSVFADPKRREKFLKYLGGIRTGWPHYGSPFYSVVQKGDRSRLVHAAIDLSPASLIPGLEENRIWPTGVMKFFAMMADGGLLSVGGWTQAGYCTEIKIQAVKLLRMFGEHERASALMTMPTAITAVGPCWGIDKVNDTYQLLDAITVLLDTSSVDFSYITNLTGSQTFFIAAPTLYSFLLGEPTQMSYTDLENISL